VQRQAAGLPAAAAVGKSRSGGGSSNGAQYSLGE